MDEYINKIEQIQEETIVLEKCKYDQPKLKYIKGYMLDRFYTPEEYNNFCLQQKGRD